MNKIETANILDLLMTAFVIFKSRMKLEIYANSKFDIWYECFGNYDFYDVKRAVMQYISCEAEVQEPLIDKVKTILLINLAVDKTKKENLNKKLNSDEICLLAYLLTFPDSRLNGIDYTVFNSDDTTKETLTTLRKKGYIKIEMPNQKIHFNFE